jgi:hypothetical protein
LSAFVIYIVTFSKKIKIKLILIFFNQENEMFLKKKQTNKQTNTLGRLSFSNKIFDPNVFMLFDLQKK